MTVQMFLGLLFAFATITGLITEVIKKLMRDKENISYNITSFIVAIIVGGIGTSIYYYLNDMPFNGKNIIFIFLLGLASGLSSQLGYQSIAKAIGEIMCAKGKEEIDTFIEYDFEEENKED